MLQHLTNWNRPSSATSNVYYTPEMLEHLNAQWLNTPPRATRATDRPYGFQQAAHAARRGSLEGLRLGALSYTPIYS